MTAATYDEITAAQYRAFLAGAALDRAAREVVGRVLDTLGPAAPDVAEVYARWAALLARTATPPAAPVAAVTVTGLPAVVPDATLPIPPGTARRGAGARLGARLGGWLHRAVAAATAALDRLTDPSPSPEVRYAG